MSTVTPFGIPQDLFDAVQDKVLEFREEHKIKHTVNVTTKQIKVPNPRIPNRFLTKSEKTYSDALTHSYRTYGNGVGLAEFLSYYALEYKWELSKVNDNKWEFADGDGKKLIVEVSDKVYIWQDHGIREVTFTKPMTTNGVTTMYKSTLTTAQIAELLSTQEANVLPWVNGSGFVYVGKKVDTSKVIANLYCTIERDDDVITTDVIVNGQSFKDINFGSMAYPSGKTGNSFVVDWVLYNEHTPSTPIKWLTEGDGGEAVRKRIADKSDVKATSLNVAIGDEAGYDEATHTITYDPTKQSVLMFRIESNQALGHEDTWEVCIDLNTDTVYYSRFDALRVARGIEV